MGPCNWSLNPTCAVFEEATATQQQQAIDLASWLLWSWSGKVFGVCPATVRPCFQPPDHTTTYRGRDGGAGMTYWPGLINGQWTNGPCGCGQPNCTCTSKAEVPLPGPVYSVTEVSIDGVPVDPALYVVKNNRWLRRVDGQAWPQEQDLDAADDAVGAFVVTYLRGIPLPDAGRVAAEAYACELVRGFIGDACGIPDRAVSVARQGVDIQLLDEQQFVIDGLTGVPIVDRWILSINPKRIQNPPKVYNPDTYANVVRVRDGW